MRNLFALIIILVVSSCASVEKPEDSQKHGKEVIPQKEPAQPVVAKIITAYEKNDLKKMKTFSNEDIATQFFKFYNQKEYEKFLLFYNTKMKEALPAEKTKATYSRFFKACGVISDIGESKKTAKAVFTNTVKCEKDKEFDKFNFIFVLDPENRIAGIYIQPTTDPIKFPKINEKSIVDDIAKAITSRKKIAGIVIGTYLNGEEKTYAFGYNSIKDKTPVKENMIFEIGSITKTFTAAILLQLEAEGKLNVDDPIQKYLPENVKIPTFPGDDTQITFKHIASHTSGLPKMPTNLAKYTKDPANPYANYPVEGIYEFINSYKLTRKPGETYEYSNIAVGLLGNILVKIDGKESYEEMIQERIFKPLGMNSSTTLISKVNKDLLAVPHSGGHKTSNLIDESMAAAGAIKTDAKDMLKYIKALIENTHPKILPEKMFTELHLWKKDSALCFFWGKSVDPNGITIYGHAGGTLGYTADLRFDKENKAGVIILSNDSEATGEAARKILQILLKKYDE